MATDATGTPTSPDSIPTYNTAVDAPSGKGFNAAMASIQTALSARVGKPAGLVTGETAIWNGATFVRSSVTGLTPSGIAGYPADATKVLKGDGTWNPPNIYVVNSVRTSPLTNGGGTFSAGTDVFSSALSFTADGVSPYIFDFYAPSVTHSQISTVEINLNLDGADGGVVYFANVTVAGGNLVVGTLSIYLGVLSNAVHTVNARMFSGAGTTLTMQGGPGGVGQWKQIFGGVRKVL